MTCPFCERLAGGDALAGRLPDAYPVADGHTLVVPRRHESDLFALAPAEWDAVWQLVADVKAELEVTYSPDGFNVGVNVGAAAGQTVAHAHVHVIPRFEGDVPDPRGGVRWVIPEKAPYWRGR